MITLRIRIAGLGLLLFLVHSCSKQENLLPEQYVVLVSFDGFRWDYSRLYETPNFDRMAVEGVKAERLIPSFPTKTFPNHYTIVTGLYPDHHGIINNSFDAPDLGGVYRIGDRQMVSNPDAYSGEPIWMTAENQGIKSACFFWVGSEAPIGGSRPSYWERYDESVPYLERVDQVIEWLELPPRKRPGLITLYFDEPDAIGHDFGPVHDSTAAMVQYLDQILGTLRNLLNNLDHGDRINLLVVSDHGMAAVSPDRYINLSDHIRQEWSVSVTGGNPVYLIRPAKGCADSITGALEGIPGVNAWKAGDIPAHFHYGNHPRFPGIVVVADSTWSIGIQPGPSGYARGAHGYDPRFTSMHTIFYADGPAFRDGYAAGPICNVDIYNLVARVLKIQPAPNDGDLQRVADIFSQE